MYNIDYTQEAIGDLYKRRLITITDTGIALVE